MFQKQNQSEDSGLFRWSLARDRQFTRCLRGYYYLYYAGRRGYEARKGEERRIIHTMSSLRTRAMWRGEVIHHLINTVFNNRLGGVNLQYEQAEAILVRIMTNEWDESADWLVLEDPYAFNGLAEHFYGALSTDHKELERDLEIARRHLRALFESRMLEEITAPGVQVLEKEDRRGFDARGVEVGLKIDLAIRDDQDRVFLMDWKTGRPQGEPFELDDPDSDGGLQLKLYALYIHARYATPFERIFAQQMYLADNQSFPLAITPEAIKQTRVYIDQSAGKMQRMHPDLSAGRLQMDLFPTTLRETECPQCRYRGLCHPKDYAYPGRWRKDRQN